MTRKTKRRRYDRQRYTVQTATRRYVCMVQGCTIEPGEQYTRRRYRTHTGDYVTLAKCRRCVPIREG